VNIIDAAHKTVHAYPGGSESLAPRIGMSPAVLRNKVNPNNTTHHLTIVEADEVMSVTGDCRMLHVLAGNHGYVLVEAASKAEQGESLLQSILQANAIEGDLDRKLDEILADGKVTPNELREFTDAVIAQQASTTRLLSRVAQFSASQRPELRAVG
jgi:hypothetical protein